MLRVASLVVCSETSDEGEDVGRELGRSDGRDDGEDVGEDDGLLDGSVLGRGDGSYEGTAVGVAVGLALILAYIGINLPDAAGQWKHPMSIDSANDGLMMVMLLAIVLLFMNSIALITVTDEQ